MRLFRFIPAALLIAGALPCLGQTATPSQSTQFTEITPKVQLFQGQKHPVLLFQGQSRPCVVAVVPGAAVPSTAKQMKLCSQLKNQQPSANEGHVLGKSAACYSIRDYQFGVPKGSEAPKLKSYSTCVPAARFEAKDVVELPEVPQK